MCSEGTDGLTWGKEEESRDEKQKAVVSPEKHPLTLVSPGLSEVNSYLGGLFLI